MKYICTKNCIAINSRYLDNEFIGIEAKGIYKGDFVSYQNEDEVWDYVYLKKDELSWLGIPKETFEKRFEMIE